MANITLDMTAKISGYQASIQKFKSALQNVDAGSIIGKKLTKAIQGAEGDLKRLAKNPMPKASSNSQIQSIVQKYDLMGQRLANIGQLFQQLKLPDLKQSAFGDGFKTIVKDLEEAKIKADEFINKTIREGVQSGGDLADSFKKINFNIGDTTTAQEMFAALGAKAEQSAQKIANLEKELKQAEAEVNKRQKAEAAAVAKQDNNLAFQENVERAATGYKKAMEEIQTMVGSGLSKLLVGNTDRQQQLLTNFMGGLTPQTLKSHIQILKNTLQTQLKGTGQGSAKNIYSTLFGQFGKGSYNLTGDALLKNFDLENIISNLRDAIQNSVTNSKFGLTSTMATNALNLIDVGNIQQAAQDVIMRLQSAYNQITTVVNQRKSQLAAATQGQNVAQNNLAAEKQTATDIENATKALQDQIIILQNKNNDLNNRVTQLQSALKAVQDKGLNSTKGLGKSGGNNPANSSIPVERVREYNAQLARAQAAEQMVGKIQGVVQRWFSVYTVVRKIGQAIRSVISTVKQLDKTITEIAIVTDMDQNDLWGQMDKYTDMATKYAASISGVYKVSQLYYQQGLQMVDVMALTEQTLKMSRISGLDYTAATNYMTNAVRSFKMEMTDAQQVVDAYSAVAASSATSVSELATAMSKTASSAQAVGSSFQNTTAMMAVMIEATRESAENIGSAMKSIISRYGEMTSDPTLLKDSEGQEMSLNRVDKALQSVGITIHDTQGQFRDFDDVIMELAEKWDTIDTNTQRYIATIMAGNRQQSRFLALVSSYDRLKELTQIANNSQDASQLQYLKTLDSVDAKVQQLQTSLQSLYTESGVQNLYKGFLDFENSIVKSLSSMTTVFGLPVSAIAAMGKAFYNVANIVNLVFNGIKVKIHSFIQEIRAYLRAASQAGTQERIAGRQQETEQYKAQDREMVASRQQAQGQMNSAATGGSTTRASGGILSRARNKVNNSRIGQNMTQHEVGWRTGLSVAGLALSAASTMVKNPKAQAGLSIAASTATYASMGLAMGGPWGAAIGAGLGLITGVVSNWSKIVQPYAEKMKRLSQQAAQANNESLQKKNEAKSLADQIASLKKLQAARYDSVQAQQQYYTAANKLAQTYPELISYMDLAGNVTVDLIAAQAQLNNVRQQSIDKAKQAAKKQYEKLRASEQHEQGEMHDAVPEFTNDTRLRIIAQRVADASGFTGTEREKFIEQYMGIASFKQFKGMAGKDQEQFYRINAPAVLRGAVPNYQQLIIQKALEAAQLAGVYTPQLEGTIKANLLDGTSPSFFGSNDFRDLAYGNLNSNFNNSLPFYKKYGGRYETLYARMFELMSDKDVTNDHEIVEIYNWLKQNQDTSLGKFFLEQVNNYIKEYKDYLNSKVLSQSGLRSGVSTVVGSSLIGVKNTTLEGFSNVQNIISEQIIARIKEKYNDDGMITTKQFNEFVDEDLSRQLETIKNFWTTIWTKFTPSQKNNFNSLTKKVNILSRQQFGKELESIGIIGENQAAVLNALYSNQYSYGTKEDTIKASFINRYRNKDEYDTTIEGADTLLGTIKEQIKDKSGTFLQNLGSNELNAVNEFYDMLQNLINSGNITQKTGSQILKLYLSIGKKLSAQTDLAKRQQAQSYFYGWDGTISGLYQLGDNLSDLGFDCESEIHAIIDRMPINLITEFSSLTTKTLKQLEDFQDIMSKVEKGMQIQDASKLAETLGLSLKDNFTNIGGKYYINDWSKLKEKYITYRQEFLAELNKDFEDAKTAIKNFNDIKLSEDKPYEFEEGKEVTWKTASTTEKVKILQKEYQQKTKKELDESTALLMVQYYETYSDAWERLSTTEKASYDNSFVEYAIKQLQLQNQNAKEVLNSLLTPYVTSLINVGNYLEAISALKDIAEKIDPKSTSDWAKKPEEYLAQIKQGDFSNLPDQLRGWAVAIWEAYKKTQTSIYDAAIKSIDEGPQLITISEDNKDLIHELTNIPLDKLTSGQSMLIDWNKLNKDYEWLRNKISGSNLLLGDKRKLLDDLHSKEFQVSKPDILSIIGNNYKEISRATMSDLAKTLGKDVETFMKEFPSYFKMDEITGLYEFIGQDWNAFIAQMENQWKITLTDQQRSKVIASFKTNKYEQSKEKAIAEAIQNYDSLSEQQVEYLKNVLEVPEEAFINNGDGTYTIKTSSLVDLIRRYKKDLSQKTENLIYDIIDASMESTSDAMSLVSEGTTDFSQARNFYEKYRTIMEQMGKESETKSFDQAFIFDQNTQSLQLSPEVFSSYISTLQDYLYTLGYSKELVTKMLLAQKQKYLAGRVDIEAYLESAKTTKDQTILTDAMYQYYIGALGYTESAARAAVQADIDAIKKGGADAVRVGRDWANRRGVAFTVEDIESLYFKNINGLLDALDAHVGDVVTDQAAKFLKDYGYTIEGNVIKGIGNTAAAVKAYHKQLINMEASVTQKYSAAMKAIIAENNPFTKKGANYISQLNDISAEDVSAMFIEAGWDSNTAAEWIDEQIKNSGISINPNNNLNFSAKAISDLASKFNWDTTSNEYNLALSSFANEEIEAATTVQTQLQQQANGLKDLATKGKANVAFMEAAFRNINFTDGTDALDIINDYLDSYGISIQDGILTYTGDNLVESLGGLRNVILDAIDKNIITEDKAAWMNVVRIIDEQITNIYLSLFEEIGQYTGQTKVFTDEQAQLLSGINKRFSEEYERTGQVTLRTAQDYLDAVNGLYESAREGYKQGTISLKSLNDFAVSKIKANNNRPIATLNLVSTSDVAIDNINEFLTTIGAKVEDYINTETGELTELGQQYFTRTGYRTYEINNFEHFVSTMARDVDKQTSQYIDAWVTSQKNKFQKSKETLLQGLVENRNNLTIDDIGNIMKILNLSEEEVAQYFTDEGNGNFSIALEKIKALKEKYGISITKGVQQGIFSQVDQFLSDVSSATSLLTQGTMETSEMSDFMLKYNKLMKLSGKEEVSNFGDLFEWDSLTNSFQLKQDAYLNYLEAQQKQLREAGLWTNQIANIFYNLTNQALAQKVDIEGFIDSDRTQRDVETLRQAMTQYYHRATTMSFQQINSAVEEQLRILQDENGIEKLNLAQEWAMRQGRTLTNQQKKKYLYASTEGMLQAIRGFQGQLLDADAAAFLKAHDDLGYIVDNNNILLKVGDTTAALKAYHDSLIEGIAAPEDILNAGVEYLQSAYVRDAGKIGQAYVGKMSSMSLTDLSGLFETYGHAEQFVSTVEQWLAGGYAQITGNGQIRFLDQNVLADSFGWDKTSDAYLNEISSYRSSMIELRENVQSNIQSEIESLKDFSVGKQFNLSYLTSKVDSEDLNNLNMQLMQYGATIQNGVLTNVGNNIIGVLNTLQYFYTQQHQQGTIDDNTYRTITSAINSQLGSIITNAANNLSSFSGKMTITGDTANILAALNQDWANELNTNGQIVIDDAEEFIQAASYIYYTVEEAFNNGTVGLSTLNDSYANLIKNNNLQDSSSLEFLSSANSLNLDAISTFVTAQNKQLSNYLTEAGNLTQKGSKFLKRTGVDSYIITDWNEFMRNFGSNLAKDSKEYIDYYTSYLANKRTNSYDSFMTQLIPNMHQLDQQAIAAIAYHYGKMPEDIIGFLGKNIDGTYHGTQQLMEFLFTGAGTTEQIKKILGETYQEISSTFIDSVMTWFQNVSYVLGENNVAIANKNSDEYKNLEKAYDEFKKRVESLGGSLPKELNSFKEFYSIIANGGEDAITMMQLIANYGGIDLSPENIATLYRGSVDRYVNALQQLTSAPGSIIDATTAEIISASDAESVALIAEGQYVVTSVINLYEAYNYVLQQLITSGHATLEEINSVAAKTLSVRDKQQVVIDALGDASNMTFDTFAQILTKQGIMLSEELVDALDASNIIELLGGDKLRITDFNAFANMMGWQAGSTQYIDALKTYNQAMIDLNNKITRNIGQEVEGLSGLTGGEWLDVTDLWSELGRKESDYTTQRQQKLIKMIAALKENKDKVDSAEYQKWMNQYTQELKGLQSIPGSIKQLNDQLKQYGGYVQNGILKTVEGANIVGIMQTIYNAAEQGSLMLSEDLAELADAISQLFKNFADIIANGLKGSLDNVGKLKLQDFAKNVLGIQLNQAAFSMTLDGIKLNTQAAIALYTALKDVDTVAAEITFEALKDSLQGAGQDCQNISKTMANIAVLQQQLSNGPDNQALRERLSIYKEIAQAQMQQAEQYDFMNRKLPEYLQGPLNYINSIGKAYKVMNQAMTLTYFDNATGKKITSTKPEDLVNATGYHLMAVDDFYNLVNQFQNLATITGQPLMFYGYQIAKDTDGAARLINQAFSNLINIDGQGAMINMGKIGLQMQSGAADMSTNFHEALKAMATSQIEMIDGMILLLESVVAMEKLGSVTTDDVIIELPEIFMTDDNGNPIKLDGKYQFQQPYKDAAQEIIAMAKTNKDLEKSLNALSIQGVSLYKMIEAAGGDADKLQSAYEEVFEKGNLSPETYTAFVNSLYQMAISGDYSTENLIRTIKQIAKESKLTADIDLGDGRTLVIHEGTTVLFGKDGKVTIGGKTFSYSNKDEVQAAINAQMIVQQYPFIKDLEKYGYEYDVDTQATTITLNKDTNIQYNMCVDPKNGVQYSADGKNYSSDINDTWRQLYDKAMLEQYGEGKVPKFNEHDYQVWLIETGIKTIYTLDKTSAASLTSEQIKGIKDLTYEEAEKQWGKTAQEHLDFQVKYGFKFTEDGKSPITKQQFEKAKQGLTGVETKEWNLKLHVKDESDAKYAKLIQDLAKGSSELTINIHTKLDEAGEWAFANDGKNSGGNSSTGPRFGEDSELPGEFYDPRNLTGVPRANIFGNKVIKEQSDNTPTSIETPKEPLADLTYLEDWIKQSYSVTSQSSAEKRLQGIESLENYLNNTQSFYDDAELSAYRVELQGLKAYLEAIKSGEETQEVKKQAAEKAAAEAAAATTKTTTEAAANTANAITDATNAIIEKAAAEKAVTEVVDETGKTTDNVNTGLNSVADGAQDASQNIIDTAEAAEQASDQEKTLAQASNETAVAILNLGAAAEEATQAFGKSNENSSGSDENGSGSENNLILSGNGGDSIENYDPRFTEQKIKVSESQLTTGGQEQPGAPDEYKNEGTPIGSAPTSNELESTLTGDSGTLNDLLSNVIKIASISEQTAEAKDTQAKEKFIAGDGKNSFASKDGFGSSQLKQLPSTGNGDQTTAKKIADTGNEIAQAIDSLNNKIFQKDIYKAGNKKDSAVVSDTFSLADIMNNITAAFKNSSMVQVTNGQTQTGFDFQSAISGAQQVVDAANNASQSAAAMAQAVAQGVSNATGSIGTLASAMNSIPSSGSGKIYSLVSAINSIPYKKLIQIVATIQVKMAGGGENSPATVKGQSPAKDKQISIAAKGNVALAGGNQKTLMGQLGPELVVANGKYNVVGQNGAEMVDLPPDAIVFNHLQTRRLLSGGKGGHGKPVTNQRVAVSLATGTVGPALASASAALAALKQIRAMWQTILNASAQDLGSLAGKQAAGGGSGGGGGGNKDKEVKTTTAEIERWYNLTRQIDKLEQDITHQQTLRDKLESDRIANGQAIYNSRRKQLENLMEQITATKELIYLQKSWYDRKRAQLAASTYGNIFTYDENGLQQYTSGLGKGLDVLEKLTTRDVNGKITGWAESADKQIQYLKSIGFDTEVLKYNDDGTVIDFKNKGDKSDNELYMQMMQNFWDGVDGWKETLDSLYDSYRQSTENILSLESDINGILEQIVDNQRKVEDAVVKAIEDRQKEIIDKLQDQRDAIEKSSQKYLKGLQDQLEREQQMYQNQKENRQIDKLRRQILILQRTGGSTSEISSLQQQLDEKQRDSYFNMQQEAIDAMQQASDAQLQRLDAQLDVMNETLQYQKEHGLLWEEVTSIMSQDAQDIVSFLLTNTKDYQSYSALQLEEQKLQIQKEAQQWVGYRKDLQPFWSKMNDTIKEAIEGSADIGWRTTDAAMQSIFGENWDKEDPTVKERFDQYVKGTGDDAKAQQQTIKDLMPKKPEKQQSTTTQQTTTGGGSSGHGATVIRGSRTQGTRAGTTQTPTVDTSLEDKAAIIPENMKQSFKRSLRGADTLTQTLNDISNLTDNIKGTIENDVINNNQRNMVQDTTINFNIQSNDAKNVAREVQNVLVRQGFRSGYRQV